MKSKIGSALETTPNAAWFLRPEGAFEVRRLAAAFKNSL
jgi:hypothetical protein